MVWSWPARLVLDATSLMPLVLPSALRGPMARLGKPQHRRGVLGRVLIVNQGEHNAHGDLRLAIELATALA